MTELRHDGWQHEEALPSDEQTEIDRTATEAIREMQREVEEMHRVRLIENGVEPPRRRDA